MKIVWIVSFVMAFVLIESNACAQLIPRRARTRPCPASKLPSHPYQVDARSRSVTAFSDQFVYFDNPVEDLGQPATVEPAKKIEIKTVATEKQVISREMLDALNSNGIASSVGKSVIANGGSPVPTLPPQLTPNKIKDQVTTTTESITIPPGTDLATIQRDKKLFQWRQDMLKIDHCSISNMAVQLSKNGDWVLNLRADQNRTAGNGRYNPSKFIKRNQFEIVLRCYGNLDARPLAQGIQTGKPVLAEIKVDKFWVQNGKPEFLVDSKNQSLIAQNFDLIDRVEIEFSYYK